MADLTEVGSEGKAWWGQMQRQRAMDAGCQFYVHRPGTSHAIISKQQHATFCGHKQGCENGRPSTVGGFQRSARDNTGAQATLTDQHASCIMQPCTPPKLPARRALVSTQTSRAQLSSAAVSHLLPASRGNDWSPVHSRPTTRGAVSNMYEVKHPGAAHVKLTIECGQALVDDLDIASMQRASKHAQPSLPGHSKQSPNRVSSISARPLLKGSSVDRTDPQASASTLADSTRSTSGTQETPDTPATAATSPMLYKGRPPLLINTNDRVKVFSMMHPGQRQHEVARLKAAIGRRIEAWVPITEAQLAAQVPHTLAEEEAEAAAEAEGVAVRRLQYRAVPPGRGPQRAAVHAIMTQGAVRKQRPDALVAEGSAWDSQKMRSAYIKAVHVAKLAEGAATAQKRRESQQSSSSAALASAPFSAWPTTSQPQQKLAAAAGGATFMSTAVPSSSFQGSATLALRLGKAPTFKRLLSSNCPTPGHSRLSSHHSVPTDLRSQPLSRRPSTVAGHAAPRHAPPPKLPGHAKRPATVGCTSSPGPHALHGSSHAHKTGRPSTEPATASLATLDQDSPSSGSFGGATIPRKVCETAEAGSLDAALQRQSKTAPEEVWCAALSAADLGHLQESEQARFSRLLQLDSPRHSHTHLTPKNMLCFAQEELSSSNESSPALSPRRPNRAVDFVPGLKARCAVADSDSPGVTPRLVVHSRDVGVARFEGHPAGDVDEHVEEVRERVALLAARLVANASPETRNGANKTASIATVMLQDQRSPSWSPPMWGEHLRREKCLYDAADLNKANALAFNPMCHPLLTAVAGV